MGRRVDFSGLTSDSWMSLHFSQRYALIFSRNRSKSLFFPRNLRNSPRCCSTTSSRLMPCCTYQGLQSMMCYVDWMYMSIDAKRGRYWAHMDTLDDVLHWCLWWPLHQRKHPTSITSHPFLRAYDKRCHLSNLLSLVLGVASSSALKSLTLFDLLLRRRDRAAGEFVVFLGAKSCRGFESNSTATLVGVPSPLAVRVATAGVWPWRRVPRVEVRSWPRCAGPVVTPRALKIDAKISLRRRLGGARARDWWSSYESNENPRFLSRPGVGLSPDPRGFAGSSCGLLSKLELIVRLLSGLENSFSSSESSLEYIAESLLSSPYSSIRS